MLHEEIINVGNFNSPTLWHRDVQCHNHFHSDSTEAAHPTRTSTLKLDPDFPHEIHAHMLQRNLWPKTDRISNYIYLSIDRFTSLQVALYCYITISIPLIYGGKLCVCAFYSLHLFDNFIYYSHINWVLLFCFFNFLSKKQNKTKNTLTLIIKILNFRSNNQFTHSLLFILYIHTYIHTYINICMLYLHQYFRHLCTFDIRYFKTFSKILSIWVTF